MTETLGSADAILARGRMTEEDVARLRREIFADGAADHAEAELAFRLNDECREKHESWDRLFIDALTDHFVWKARPRGYVDETKARYLMRKVLYNNRIDGPTELELLANIVHWAEWVPAELAEFVLFAVKQSVLDPDTAVYGRERRPQVIDAIDIELVKRAIYAPSSRGSIRVTREEADAIFDLNDGTVTAENHPGWKSLFVYAIGNHLMFPREVPAPPPAEEVLRREQWLKERDGVGGFLKKVGRESAGFAGDVFGRRRMDLEERFELALQAMKDPLRERDPAAEAREAGIALERETVDAEEARWLIERLRRHDGLDANEVALLAFIRNTSPRIDPSLGPLFAEAGLG